MDRKGESLVFNPNAGQGLKIAARRQLGSANGGKGGGTEAHASSVRLGAVQPEITQSFHIQQCLEITHPAAADNGYEKASISHKAAEHLFDLWRHADFGRVGLQWNEGSVAIE